MKMFFATAKSLLIASAAIVAMNSSAQAPDLENDEDARISYAVGINIGQSLIQQGLVENIELDAFVAGLRDQINDDVKLNDEQMLAAIQAFQQRLQAQQEAMQAAQQEAANQNLEAGRAFLAENATKEGVVVLDSGLQYMVLESGDASGASPRLSNTVSAHYHGTVIDGRVFDSSVDRGTPASFPVSGVISGWTEALQLMKVGDKWRLFIPTEMAYGANPPPSDVIEANSALIFDVELLDIE